MYTEKTPLTRAQEKFLSYFIEQDFKNSSMAYQRAYPTANDATARVQSTRYLARPNIQKRLCAKIDEVLEADKKQIEKRIKDYWVTRGLYNTADILTDDGKLKEPLSELKKKGLDIVIDGIETKPVRVGDKLAKTTKYKLADRDKALEMLSRYIQMIKQNDVSGTIVLNITPDEAEAAK
jgi:hypothetical protein